MPARSLLVGLHGPGRTPASLMVKTGLRDLEIALNSGAQLPFRLASTWAFPNR